MPRAAFVLAALLFTVAAVACKGTTVQPAAAFPQRPQVPTVAPTATPTPTPVPNLPPSAMLTFEAVTHAGIATVISVAAADPEGTLVLAAIDFGDGSPEEVFAIDGGRREVDYTYTAPGEYTVLATATDSDGIATTVGASLDVLPRKLLIVRGYGSSAQCPNGGNGGFAEPWLADLVARSPEVRPEDVLYASYSGAWCDGGDGANGSWANYDDGDTCDGIDDAGGLAERLRAQIDAVAPAMVTIVGHSMGGLGAAYLVGSDPDWARGHIASVVTFDSPLRGVPRLNLTALRLGGDCSYSSKSGDDLSDGNDGILSAAAVAAETVPFYNLDATAKESVWGIAVRQAVPSDRTHLDGEEINWRIGVDHNGLWHAASQSDEWGATVMAALQCAVDLVPGAGCVEPGTGGEEAVAAPGRPG